MTSEKLVKKATRRVMKDKCLTCLKFHFTGKLTKKKLCPFAIENLNSALHFKMAPELALFAHNFLHNYSLTGRTMPHSDCHDVYNVM